MADSLPATIFPKDEVRRIVAKVLVDQTITQAYPFPGLSVAWDKNEDSIKVHLQADIALLIDLRPVSFNAE